MTTVRAALRAAAGELTSAGVEEAEREAAWLLAHLLGCSVGELRLRSAWALAPEQLRSFEAMVARRARREPIQYILGTEEFLGLTFRVTPAVLIPRLDTETLVREAVARLAGRGPVRVADIGTGSGAIAVAVAHLLPEATVVAVDLSREALAVAAENARLNRVADRVEFRQGDLLTPLATERYDAILSNPPYVGEAELPGLMPEVRDWEPHLALTPGPDAYEIYRRLFAEAPARLKPGGLLGVEVGIRQAPVVAALLRQAGFGPVTVHRDTAGVERAVLAAKQGEDGGDPHDQPDCD
ncbi:MAG: peptide chain release factor N(5)-glutamine methyltransferase [Bacillota bacterium]